MTGRSAISRSRSTPIRTTPRTDRIPGDVELAGQSAPGWGIHLIDVNVAQGDLIRVVAGAARCVPEATARR